MEPDEIIEQTATGYDWETILILIAILFIAMLPAMIIAMLVVRHIV